MKKKIAAVLLATAVVVSATPMVSADAATKVSVAKSVTVKKGGVKTISLKNADKNTKAKWTTSNSKIVKITKKKAKKVTVKGVSVGKAVVTAKVGSKKLKCKVYVGATSLSVSNKKKTVEVGKSYTVKATMKNGKGDKVTYKSTKPSVLSVKKLKNNQAEITGVMVGEATVKATTKSGKTVKWKSLEYNNFYEYVTRI